MGPHDRGRVHLRAVGHPAVELGLDQRTDVDPVDGHALDLAGDLDVDQLEPDEADVVEGDGTAGPCARRARPGAWKRWMRS